LPAPKALGALLEIGNQLLLPISLCACFLVIATPFDIAAQQVRRW
jgi:hypothetical protein